MTCGWCLVGVGRGAGRVVGTREGGLRGQGRGPGAGDGAELLQGASMSFCQKGFALGRDRPSPRAAEVVQGDGHEQGRLKLRPHAAKPGLGGARAEAHLELGVSHAAGRFAVQRRALREGVIGRGDVGEARGRGEGLGEGHGPRGGAREDHGEEQRDVARGPHGRSRAHPGPQDLEGIL